MVFRMKKLMSSFSYLLNHRHFAHFSLFIILFISLAFTLNVVFSQTASASIAPVPGPGPGFQSGNEWYTKPTAEWANEVFTEPPEKVFKERWVLSNIVDIENSAITSLEGVSCPPGTTCYSPDGTPYTHRGGAVNVLAHITARLYTTPPASSVDYLAYLGNNLGVTPAYAQGIGFYSFAPILRLWTAFRNIAYLGYVVIFVIIGLMIMFRKKIDPRTVVTVQEALPRIIITLLLITFSYAIAGLLIDSSAFLIRLTGSTLAKEGLICTKNTGTAQQDCLNNLYANNIFELVNPLRSVDAMMSIIDKTQTPLVSDAPFDLGKITIKFIFSLASIFIMFKIFFALIGPYAGIVLSIILSPFVLLFGTIPGASNTFGSWIKDLLSKILVFPATFAMLALAAVIKGQTGSDWLPGGYADWQVNGSYQLGWSPATIGNWGPWISHLVAFSILFTIPKAAQMIQDALQVKPGPGEAAPGEEIKAAAGKLPFLGGYISRQM